MRSMVFAIAVLLPGSISWAEILPSFHLPWAAKSGCCSRSWHINCVPLTVSAFGDHHVVTEDRWPVVLSPEEQHP
jgi:hypothetical protein